MYTSFMHQFTEKAIQDLLGKSSTPKVVKSSSDYELKLDNQSGQKIRTNIFDLPTETQNIVTRGSFMRPKTLDIKNKIKLESNLEKINENGKDELSVYHSIKEEQEEQDDCLELNNKSGDKLNKNDCKLIESNKVNPIKSNDKSNKVDPIKLNDKSNKVDPIKLNDESNKVNPIKLNDESNKVTIEKNDQKKDIEINKDIKLETNKINNSSIETIVLDDSSIIETVQSISKISIKESNNDKLTEHNGLHNNNLKDNEQQNCLYIKNLPYSVCIFYSLNLLI